MKIEIDEEGIVWCDGLLCSPSTAQTSPCVDCQLHKVFTQMFAACDPLKCKLIVCAGCESRFLAERVRALLGEEEGT